KNIDNVEIADPLEIPIGQGIVGTVALTGIPEIVVDCSADPRYIVDDAARLSEICIPIVYEDQVIGIIDSEHPERGFYTTWHLEVLESIAAISATKIVKTLVEEENTVLARFFEESPTPMLRLTSDGTVISANKSAEPLISIWQGDNGNVINPSILLEARRAMELGQDQEKEIEFGDRILALRFVPISERGYVNLYSTDVTEIRQAQREAERANRAKDNFLSVMSHEIRTPLNAILGITALLQDTPLNAEQEDFLRTLDFSGRNLLEIVNDILDLEKILAGKVVVQRIPFDLARTLSQLERTFTYKSGANNNDIEFLIEPDVPSIVVGDEYKLVQVLGNLLSNSNKFTKGGKIELKVALLQSSNEGYEILFCIEDTGIGIARDKVSRIFQPFEQAEYSTTRQYGGTGLGLTIVKRLLDFMGGSLLLESEPGVGTRIEVRLRFDRSGVDFEEEVGSPSDLEQLVGRSILVVDDNPINLMIAEQFLMRWEMVVHKADDGNRAVEAVLKHEPEIVLMDLQMPHCDGFEATRKIRSMSDAFQNLPIVALSADVVQSTREEALRAGMDDIITKPFNPEKLQRLLVELLGKRS
ncbi:MAG: response regulator, partial [Flavobacteriales bacterium]|nr:response regulator [Flavobacteriales bacterium]